MIYPNDAFRTFHDDLFLLFLVKGPGVVVQDQNPQEGETEGQVLVDFASGQYSRLHLGKRMRVEMSCSLAGSGGEIYAGHLPCAGIVGLVMVLFKCV